MFNSLSIKAFPSVVGNTVTLSLWYHIMVGMYGRAKLLSSRIESKREKEEGIGALDLPLRVHPQRVSASYFACCCDKLPGRSNRWSKRFVLADDF